MKEILDVFRIYTEKVKRGSVEDVEYLIDVFEYEIYHTSKLKNDKQKKLLKNTVLSILNTIEKPDENVLKLKNLLI